MTSMTTRTLSTHQEWTFTMSPASDLSGDVVLPISSVGKERHITRLKACEATNLARMIEQTQGDVR